jgi:hypothetical protein
MCPHICMYTNGAGHKLYLCTAATAQSLTHAPNTHPHERVETLKHMHRCRYMCPIGAMNGLFSKMALLEIRCEEGSWNGVLQNSRRNFDLEGRGGIKE